MSVGKTQVRDELALDSLTNSLSLEVPYTVVLIFPFIVRVSGLNSDAIVDPHRALLRMTRGITTGIQVTSRQTRTLSHFCVDIIYVL